MNGAAGVRAFVNLSANALREANLVATVAAVLSETGLPAEHLVLEITERALLNNPGPVLETMTRLNTMGVTFALDDFGAGSSGFSCLCSYPFHILKIDRSLISGLEPNSRALTIVTGIIEMARGLGMTVIAEGVETESQAALLRNAGCELAQGYLFAKPGLLPKQEGRAAA